MQILFITEFGNVADFTMGSVMLGVDGRHIQTYILVLILLELIN